jgi:proton-dependent oligopeptide transporter, POT family
MQYCIIALRAPADSYPPRNSHQISSPDYFIIFRNYSNKKPFMSEQKGHPKGLYVLFFTEMWERFSYYGMRAILILFMTKMLQFDSKFASGIYGNFTAVVYLTPLIGGFIADRYWGNRRSIFVGGLLMAIGQFVLFFCAASVSTNMDLAKIIL